MGSCWRSGETEAVAYSHRDTFQSRPIVPYYFTNATILLNTHMCNTVKNYRHFNNTLHIFLNL